MKQRCFYKKHKHYDRYGGRGITICPEWKDNFEAFYEWAMNCGYSNELSIDRIDNDGNYEPSNCRWVSAKVQNNNTQRNHYLTYNGETHTAKEWSEITGISNSTICHRIGYGWPIERVLEKGRK